jgi:CubicO group peptidase (beta-lactamase class C family)
MMSRKRTFLSFAFPMGLLAILGLVAFAGQARPSARELDRWLKEREFSGALLFAKSGSVVFQTAMGQADLAGKEPLTTRSSFNLASVSKQFTAAAVMLLFESGRVKLDESVAAYLPELAFAPEITVRHLLNHTSGLPDIYGVLEREWDKTKIAGNEQVLEILAAKKPALLFRPGDKMQYSNTGYILLASIAEKVSGLPLARFLGERVFAPLGMADTFVYTLTMPKYPRPTRVFGMKRDGGKLALDDLIYCDGMRGDGNVHSSVEDLFKWDRALYGETVLKKETIGLMLSPGRLNDGTLIDYGFGFGLSENGRVASHGGSWVGFRSLIVRYLDRQDTFIILINCLPPQPKGFVDEIQKRFFGPWPPRESNRP